jgi:hypothetical protein
VVIGLFDGAFASPTTKIDADTARY